MPSDEAQSMESLKCQNAIILIANIICGILWLIFKSSHIIHDLQGSAFSRWNVQILSITFLTSVSMWVRHMAGNTFSYLHCIILVQNSQLKQWIKLPWGNNNMAISIMHLQIKWCAFYSMKIAAWVYKLSMKFVVDCKGPDCTFGIQLILGKKYLLGRSLSNFVFFSAVQTRFFLFYKTF